MAWKGGFSGDGLTREQFAAHVSKLQKPSWLKHLTLHNSGAPNMAQARKTPGGFRQRIKNLEHYYKNQNRWASGPHGFIFDDGKIYLGTPLTTTGTHSPSWNGSAYGFEMMADFRKGVDDPNAAPGAVIFDTAAFVFATLLKKYGMHATDTTIRFHKEDPKTTHDCPGDLVKKPVFLAKVKAYMGDAETEPEVVIKEERGHELGWRPQLFSVREIQHRLAAHGFNPGPADDVMGPRTDAAIKESQRALGVAETGVVGPWQMGKLRAEPASAPAPAPTGGLSPIAMLHVSDFARSWFKRFEGLRLESYDDRGSLAIGYGHNATSNRPPRPTKGMKITREEAEAILDADLLAIEGEVKKVLKGTSLSQAHFDALMLDDFQRGQTQFTKTEHVRLFKEGRHQEAVEAMLAAAKKTAGGLEGGLGRRREVQYKIAKGEKPTKW